MPSKNYNEAGRGGDSGSKAALQTFQAIEVRVRRMARTTFEQERQLEKFALPEKTRPLVNKSAMLASLPVKHAFDRQSTQLVAADVD